MVVGQTETMDVGVEGGGMAHLGRHATDLLGHPFGPEDEAGQRQRDEATRIRAAPLFDMPVVVGPAHAPRQLARSALQEVLPTEAGPRREAHGAEDTVDIHVADPLVYVPGSLPDLFET